MSELLWIIRVCQVTFVRSFWHALLIKYFLPSMCTAKAGPWTIAPGKHPPFITWKVTQISGVTQRPSIGRTDGLIKRSSNTSQISTSLIRAVLLPEVTLCTTPSLVLVPVKGNTRFISAARQRTPWFLDMDGFLFFRGAVGSWHLLLRHKPFVEPAEGISFLPQ